MSGRSSTRTRRRLWQLGGALALAAAIGVALVLAAGGGAGGGTPARKPGERLPGQFESNARFAGIPQHGVALGDPNAPVTLVEFADLQCPFCREYTTSIFPALVAKYVKTGKVKMLFRSVAFLGTDSLRAAQMAVAAGRQNRLWPFIDLFYVNQGEESSGYVTDDFLRKIGGAVQGLDVERAMSERGIASVQTQLAAADAAWRGSGATGTPSFLVGRTGGTLELMGKQAPLSVAGMSTGIDRALEGTA